MTVTELVQKLRSKKQTAARSAFGHYLAAVKELAAGKEIDADEAGHIIEAADKNEDDLSRDVNLQSQRITWAAQLQANQQATKDRILAERDVQAARAALQEAIDKLQPAIDQAHDRLNAANHAVMITTQAESWLAGNVLDRELLDREAAVTAQLREVSAELIPLVKDRAHKADSLQNAEYTLAKLTGRPDKSWLGHGTINPFRWKNEEITPATQRVDDLQSQVRQLNSLIAPRQQEQTRLQAELNQIHAEKLKP